MRRHPVVAMVATAAAFLGSLTFTVQGQTGATEAPAGFDNKTNGFISQAEFDTVKAVFEERDEVADGLGPVYNAQSCVECHQSPVTGGGSQVAELRAGHRNGFGNFVDAPGGSLINDRAIDAAIQERVPGAENIRTLRMSTNVLGAGFIEAIASSALQALASAQPRQSGGAIAGQAISVPLLEGGSARVGRFGWKDQHASLLSFSADAYLNEIGITSRLQPNENSSMGRSVAAFDVIPRGTPNAVEDADNDIDEFAEFMRATKVPPRDTALARTSDAAAGSNLFDSIGCGICHTKSITTASSAQPPLNNRIIHPYSDFLLHDIDTGDGIVQNGGQSTANKLRTLPLWGTRTRSRHMHDGLSLTFTDAILRHGGEATNVTNRFNNLTATQRNQIVVFLQSL
jgi:CxxC motif-containing protein (DUF1111 family)